MKCTIFVCALVLLLAVLVKAGSFDDEEFRRLKAGAKEVFSAHSASLDGRLNGDEDDTYSEEFSISRKNSQGSIDIYKNILSPRARKSQYSSKGLGLPIDFDVQKTDKFHKSGAPSPSPNICNMLPDAGTPTADGKGIEINFDDSTYLQQQCALKKSIDNGGADSPSVWEAGTPGASGKFGQSKDYEEDITKHAEIDDEYKSRGWFGFLWPSSKKSTKKISVGPEIKVDDYENNKTNEANRIKDLKHPKFGKLRNSNVDALGFNPDGDITENVIYDGMGNINGDLEAEIEAQILNGEDQYIPDEIADEYIDSDYISIGDLSDDDTNLVLTLGIDENTQELALARQRTNNRWNWFMPTTWFMNIWTTEALEDWNRIYRNMNIERVDDKLKSKVRSIWVAYRWVKQKALNLVALMENNFDFNSNYKKAELAVCTANRYNSFADVRTDGNAKIYIGGKDYFYALSESIENAKHSIYIFGWIVSPFLYLRKPYKDYPQYRLDALLKRKAEEGVQIHFIVYNDINHVMVNQGQFVSRYFDALHPNIHAQAHANHDYGTTLFWSHHDKVAIIDREIAYIGGVDLGYGRFDNANYPLLDDPDNRLFNGPEFTNPRIIANTPVAHFARTFLNVTSQPRLAWHDSAAAITGSSVLDMCNSFETRWNFAKRTQSSIDEEIDYMPITNRKDVIQSPLKGNMETQIVRSLGTWSGGVYTEQSAQNAYINSILEAEHTIFIANQFFISTSSGKHHKVQNRVTEAIALRIIKAHENNENLRIYITIPSLPGAPGVPTSKTAFVLREIIYYQMKTIWSGDASIFETVARGGVTDIDKYLHFFSLRTWDQIGDASDASTYVSEMIYIHAKMMVVDDRRILLGSANINDRSQNGNHDSETVVIIDDKNYIDSVMDGKPYKVGKAAFDLRIKLMASYLGLTYDANPTSDGKSPDQRPIEIDHENNHIDEKIVDILRDPMSDKFWDWYKAVATRNTKIFRDIFRPVVDTDLVNTEEVNDIINEPGFTYGHVTPKITSAEYVQHRLSELQGILIDAPIYYLKDTPIKNAIIDTLAYSVFIRDEEPSYEEIEKLLLAEATAE